MGGAVERAIDLPQVMRARRWVDEPLAGLHRSAAGAQSSLDQRGRVHGQSLRAPGWAGLAAARLALRSGLRHPVTVTPRPDKAGYA